MIGYLMGFQSEWNYSGLKNGPLQWHSSKMDPITSGLGVCHVVSHVGRHVISHVSRHTVNAMSMMGEYVESSVIRSMMFIFVIDIGFGLG